MLIDVENQNLVAKSKVTGYKYQVYKINIENNKITDYMICNQGYMELWNVNRFYPLKTEILLNHMKELENKLKIQTLNYHSAMEDINYFCDNCIPKSKIRDKIEYLNNMIKEIYKHKKQQRYMLNEIQAIKGVLKELLD